MTWLQWNGRFRDDIRRFVKDDTGIVPEVMRRLYGSDDLFPDSRADAYHAFQSVNYVPSHDGFTLYDLVSYDRKRNWQTGITIRTARTRTTVGIVGRTGTKPCPRRSAHCAGSR